MGVLYRLFWSLQSNRNICSRGLKLFVVVLEGGDVARIIHEDFYCNLQYVAPTSLTASGLAAQSVNILFQVCFLPARLHAPVSRGVSAVSP